MRELERSRDNVGFGQENQWPIPLRHHQIYDIIKCYANAFFFGMHLCYFGM
jgi:hypothetical protein